MLRSLLFALLLIACDKSNSSGPQPAPQDARVTPVGSLPAELAAQEPGEQPQVKPADEAAFVGWVASLAPAPAEQGDADTRLEAQSGVLIVH